MKTPIHKYLTHIVLAPIFVAFAMISHASESGRMSTAGASKNIQTSDVIVYGVGEEKSVALVTYINGHVAGGVGSAMYAQSQVCEGAFDLQLNSRMGVQVNEQQRFYAKSGESIYLQVSGSNDKYSIKQVGADQAKQELANAKISPVINRFTPVCLPPVRTVKLGADSLFVNNSGRLSPMGVQQLQSFIIDVQKQVSKIDGIKVIGHTDHRGSDVSNERLSLARAKSVAHYLEQQGLNVPMVVQGSGEREPVSQGCERYTKNKTRLINCLQADRRVVIELTGQN